MLKKTRIALAALVFTAMCLLFIDVSGQAATWFAILAKWQLIPAVLAGSLAVVAAIVVVTALFGRVYCSVLCPLGVMQDLISSPAKTYRFGFRPARTKLRLFSLGVFVLAALAGAPIVMGLLEPYSAFGRVAVELLGPAWATGSNAVAWAAARAESYAVGPTLVVQKGQGALWIALATLAVLATLTWRAGRSWCNTLCPVGACLGLVSRFALWRPRIQTDACTKCGLCAKGCKASCIDAESGSIDSSRCVSCFNCLENCRHKALSVSLPQSAKASAPKVPGQDHNPTRRSLLAAAVATLAPASAFARDRKADVPALAPKQAPERQSPITPPGSLSVRLFRERCTGCQLCVASCPNQILRAFDRGDGMLQPGLSFEHGYCRVNCVACSSVCPTGAIRPITAAQKSSTQIGRAVVNLTSCITSTDKVTCTACARNCPPRAINLVGPDEGIKVPVVDAERCNGCGACEYVCPVRPLAAIIVEGNTEHRII